MRQYDAIIIGAGQSGPPLAERLSQAGWTTALIEADKIGGTCVNYGCTPTKTMIASARAIHQARRGATLGFSAGPITVDMPKVRDRVQTRVLKSRSGLERHLQDLERLDVIYGRAVFESSKTIRVNDEVLQAEQIIVNTGARPTIPPLQGLESVEYLTNRDMLELSVVPEHLIVVGGSYVGLEFAQAFRRFGSEVSIVEQGPRLIGREDQDVSEAVREIMEAEGIAVHTDSTCIAVERHGRGLAVTIDGEGQGSQRILGTHLLIATGRTPNSDLGLESAGVHLDERGYIVVDDRLATNVPGIWATGDVNGRGAFTHTSYNDYEILADVLLGDDTRRVSDRITTYALFIDPPLGRVGMTESQARQSGREVLMAKKPMSHVARALEKDETQGFMKFLVDAHSERILGAAVLGTGGDEVIASVTNVMYADAPYTTLENAVHIHPTVAELIPTTLETLKPLD